MGSSQKMSKRKADVESIPPGKDYGQIEKTLQADGYVEIEDVLSVERCQYYISEMWNWMEGFGTGVKRDDPSSWKNTKSSTVWPHTTHGLLQHYKVGQTKFAWEMRAEPEILRIFAKLWHCQVEDLIVSFDGVNMGKPTKRGTKWGKWIHLDQGPEDSTLRYYQGCLTLTDSDGGLIFHERATELHKPFWRDFKKKSKGPNWYKFQPQDEAWYVKHGSNPVFVKSKAGSLVLWDSRTPHQGQLPSDKCDTLRMCIYVCYNPKHNVSEKVMAYRRQRFAERRMTNHQPDEPKLFPLTFQTYGNNDLVTRFTNQPTIKDDELTPTMKSLIGF